jgi:pimeloyl-ACP methyl ester carboxylesterase
VDGSERDSSLALVLLAGPLLLAAGCAHAGGPAASGQAVTTVAGPHGTLRVDDGGSGGLPVLFVHGNSGNRTQWTAQLEHLRASRRAAAFDLHGMGESVPASDGNFSVESFADDVAAVADALGFRRFVLVGHSYGGFVVAAYAGKYPERLAGLVFADCAGDFSKTPPEQLAGLRRGLEPDRYEEFTRVWFEGILAGGTEETKAAVMKSLRATPRDVFVGATMSIYQFPMTQALAAYKGPRLSIASMLAENSAGVHKSIPGIPVVAVKDASHWLMMDRPEEFNRLLDAFLRSGPVR